MPMRITLTVTAGPHKGRVFVFSGHDTFIVGRSKDAHFQLPAKDRYFSRVHFLIEVNPPCCSLMDLGSRNGTYVNDTKVESAELRDGDKIQAGRTILRIAILDAQMQPTLPWAMPLSDLVAAPPQPAPIHIPFLETVSPAVAAQTPGPEAGFCPACGEGAVPGTIAHDLCDRCEGQAQQQTQNIPGYRLIRELGRGGMGIVHLALCLADKQVRALKTIIPAVAAIPSQVERFLREASILRQLDHPAIVGFRDMGEADGTLFFAMEYVHGPNIATLLKSAGPFPIARATRLVCQLLEALDYAHGQGFVHRDSKPANILVRQEETREDIKRADFGLARVYHASQMSGLTLRGEVGGTLAFMAPEQITNYREAGPAADQYAAGATLYWLLTAKHHYDFPHDVNKQIALILNRPPTPIQSRNVKLPEELARVIHRSLARAPQKRFADARSMCKALEPFVDCPPV